ncbi:hypothetical protein IAT40_005892 [Kwoniella sp. CBS 6097]
MDQDHQSPSPLLYAPPYSSPHLSSPLGSTPTPTPNPNPNPNPNPYSRMTPSTPHSYSYSYPPPAHQSQSASQSTPTPTARSTPRHDRQRQRRQRKGRFLPTARGFRSFLYHSSFYLFVAIIATLLVGSAWGLGEQSWRTGNQKSWNLIVLVAAYVVLGLISVTHVWSRILSIKKILRTMPKPYMPTKQVDIPKKVASHIATEYSRTAVIAHISQATTGQQEGWGRPGTKWEDKHFRSYILSTLPIMCQALAPNTPSPPLSLQPLLEATDPVKVGDKGALRLFVNSYAKIIENARYGRKEPTQADAEATEKVVEVVLLTLEVKSRREKNRAKV